MIPKTEWRWYGNAAHLIVSSQCRFHLATEIGRYIVSTVGEYFPNESVREIFAKSRRVELIGRGDEREADYMDKLGYEDIGYGRKYETMVFLVKGHCDSKKCGCGLPNISGMELKTGAYNTAKDATEGHNRICDEVAAGNISNGDDDE